MRCWQSLVISGRVPETMQARTPPALRVELNFFKEYLSWLCYWLLLCGHVWDSSRRPHVVYGYAPTLSRSDVPMKFAFPSLAVNEPSDIGSINPWNVMLALVLLAMDSHIFKTIYALYYTARYLRGTWWKRLRPRLILQGNKTIPRIRKKSSIIFHQGVSSRHISLKSRAIRLIFVVIYIQHSVLLFKNTYSPQWIWSTLKQRKHVTDKLCDS